MSVFCKPGNFMFEVAPDKTDEFLKASKPGTLAKAIKAINDQVAEIERKRKEREEKKK